MEMEQSPTAEALKLEPLMNDFNIESKVRAVDDYIASEQSDQTGKDLGYKWGLEKLTERLGISLLNELQKGNALKVLDRIFSEVAMMSKMASDTYLVQAKDKLKASKLTYFKERIAQLTS